jgi:glycosyltransferase involved in cell wall biosynthesis
MSILFGHPTGSPFSHNAALAHFEAGRLEHFCVPWMPSAMTLYLLGQSKPLRSMAQRLSRRHFPALAEASKVQGRAGEFRRLLIRALGWGDERLSNEANDWLMRTMTRECRRSNVTAVHAYEDCSLWQFIEAKHLGKACIYDMPIGYYPAWERVQTALAKKYAEWLPVGRLSQQVRREQKCREMELADLLLVPSNFVANTVRDFYPHRAVAIAPYGVDLGGWPPAPVRAPRDVITFLFVGQCSLRKGIPLLLEAWRAANLKGARLLLVGPWQLAEGKKRQLPPGCLWTGPVSSQRLRSFYHDADVFVFPTNFEGRALVVGEALASGLPVLTTYASGADDMIDETCGRIVAPDDLNSLVESLRWFNQNRHVLPEFSRAARVNAERCTWEHYRSHVTEAVAPFV